ncbi:hypothetical protein C5167_002942, partial [Papaver somniferum]
VREIVEVLVVEIVVEIWCDFGGWEMVVVIELKLGIDDTSYEDFIAIAIKLLFLIRLINTR